MGIISEISSCANKNMTRPEANFQEIMISEYEGAIKAQNDHKLEEQNVQTKIEATIPNMDDLMQDVDGSERQEMGQLNTNNPSYLKNGINNSEYLQQDNSQINRQQDDGFER